MNICAAVTVHVQAEDVDTMIGRAFSAVVQAGERPDLFGLVADSFVAVEPFLTAEALGMTLVVFRPNVARFARGAVIEAGRIMLGLLQPEVLWVLSGGDPVRGVDTEVEQLVDGARARGIAVTWHNADGQGEFAGWGE